VSLIWPSGKKATTWFRLIPTIQEALFGIALTTAIDVSWISTSIEIFKRMKI